ncbi:stage II sporulation protein R [Bacillus coahuilensis p1.1.43]|uniref:Stage II sporulation protein R n=1 Tax=Bacillus coahuilensis p1.1.43 TaxID=1150625 RepID=A0A147K4B2_9BACI|nr:stage II sporulation protein R [Bacillus coahuilensis]KUP04178.1 stage II sporulation protein R [Bacillus coahuilensis p1.1.43]
MKHRKQIAWLYLFLLSVSTVVSLYIPQTEKAAEEVVTIPDEAIRLRILANSDRDADQELKHLIRDEVNASITEWVAEIDNLNEARALIQTNLPKIEEIAEEKMNELGLNQTIHVEYATNVQFPTKLYGQYLYPAGEYEAILITLGEGDGSNWWCVLFPPLCFLDFSSGTAVSEGFEEEEKETQSDQEAAEQDSKFEEDVEQLTEEEQAEEMVAYLQQEAGVFVEEKEPKTEVKFFLVEFFEKLFG